MASNHAMNRSSKATPLPWDKLSIVFLMRLAEPISFSIIFPFISEKIWTEFGVAKTKGEVGFYAGIIESTFAVTQTFTVLQWGRLSDRIGRKKVMLIGLTGVALSLTLFGFAKSLLTAILARALSGALNGNAAVVKSLIGELTDASNQAKGFSLVSVGWGLGITIGPLLGGFLSRPAESFPGLFAHDSVFGLGGFWEQNPYALPCFVSALITIFSILLGTLCLEETLPSIVEKKKRQKRLLDRANYGSASASSEATPVNSKPSSIKAASSRNQNHSEEETPLLPSPGESLPQSPGESLPQSSGESLPQSTGIESAQSGEDTGIFSLLKMPHVKKVLLSYAFLSLSSVSLDAILVLFLYSPIKLGGLSMSTKQSGAILSVTGIIATLSQLLLFPILQRRLGTLKLYAISMSFFPIVCLILPATNLVARANLRTKFDGDSILVSMLEELKEGGKSKFSEELSENAQAIIWILLVFSSACRVMGGISFSCNTILVNDCTKLTNGKALGTLNGLAQMTSSLSRAVGPYSSSSLFAISISRQIAGGNMIWIILFFVGLLGSFVTSRIENLESEEERAQRLGLATQTEAS